MFIMTKLSYNVYTYSVLYINIIKVLYYTCISTCMVYT